MEKPYGSADVFTGISGFALTQKTRHPRDIAGSQSGGSEDGWQRDAV